MSTGSPERACLMASWSAVAVELPELEPPERWPADHRAAIPAIRPPAPVPMPDVTAPTSRAVRSPPGSSPSPPPKSPAPPGVVGRDIA